MAELNNTASNDKSKPGNVRNRKLTSKVDLTAMVDLAFLLITFFMLTTSLSKPRAMDLTMPDKIGTPLPVDENRTLTILIGAHNKAICYMGNPTETNQKEIALKTSGLRQELLTRKKEVLAYSTEKGTPEKGLIVIIKPSKKSDYGSLVDVLDEMAISNVPTYAIADIDSKETALLPK